MPRRQLGSRYLPIRKRARTDGQTFSASQTACAALCRSRGKSTIVTLAVSGAVLAGMLIGLIVARIVRAWHDEDANEARLRFQALYVDPATDIEDLPDQLPRCVERQAPCRRKGVSPC